MQNSRLVTYRRLRDRQNGVYDPGNNPYYPTFQADAAISGGISHNARLVKQRHERDRALTTQQQYGAGLNIPRCKMQSYSQSILVSNVPQLIIQQNPLRAGFVISNPTGLVPGTNALIVSFNYPASGSDGVILLPGDNFGFNPGQAVPIDDIYCTGAAGTLVTAYEAMPLGDLKIT